MPLGLVPWDADLDGVPGEGTKSALVCFHAWLKVAGGKKSFEERDGLEVFKQRLESTYHHHFEDHRVYHGAIDNRVSQEWTKPPPREHYGWIREIDLGDGQADAFLITSTGMKALTEDANKPAVIRGLVESGLLVGAPNGKPTKPLRVDGKNRRVYVVLMAILEDKEEPEESISIDPPEDPPF
jgi:hypothetical protein